MTVQIRPSELKQQVREFRMLIDGKWTAGAEGRMIERTAPSHGVVVSRYEAATRVDAERAIVAARKAFDEGPWPNMTAGERSNILLKAADLIAARVDEIAYLDAIEAGKPISQCKGEIGGAVDIWRHAAALARTLYRLDYLTFIANNPAVRMRRRSRTA